MYISPYIEQALENPNSKVFTTPEDVIHDTSLSRAEKSRLLKKFEFSKTANG